MNGIICPHCNYEYTEDDKYEAGEDLWVICPEEESTRSICVSCGKEFWILGGYIPTYEMFKTEDELDEY